MRTKSKVKKRASVPGWVYPLIGYILLASLVILHLSSFLFKFNELSKLFPKYAVSPWQELAIVAGGPLAVVAALALSFVSRKAAGALLLLGVALVSTGIALQSGYFLNTYLLRMAIFGVPQIAAGICFLKSDKKAASKRP